MKCSEHKSCVASNATAVFSRSQGLKNLTARLRTTDKLFAAFVYDILAYDPAERLDPAKALRHPFMAKVQLLPSLVPCFPQQRVGTMPVATLHTVGWASDRQPKSTL